MAPEALYPVPILTRDIPGYKLYPHPDTHWKGITVQLYIPRSNAHTHVGTVFHQRTSSGSLAIAKQVPFACSSGYAFVVDTHTWHSVNEVGTEIVTRDSILLTYFVDLGGLRMARNRGKRIGNFLLQEARYLGGR